MSHHEKHKSAPRKETESKPIEPPKEAESKTTEPPTLPKSKRLGTGDWIGIIATAIAIVTLLVACRRVTITRLLASKLSWLLAAKSCSPSNSSPI
jgi:hypothetical protein